MKKIIALIIALTCTVCMLAACGDSNSEKTTTGAGNEQTQDASSNSGSASKGYTFTYKGVTLYIGMDADEAVTALKDYQKGEPTKTKSCAFEGYDYQYFYGSFYMCTGTLNDHDLVDAFWFVDDTVATDEGLSIGDSKAKVEELYGSEGFNGINAYVYKDDPCWLTIILEGDSVSSIQYVYQGQIQ